MHNDISEERPPSRSAKKRAAHAIEDLAQALADLPEADWRRIPLSDEVRAEASQARGIKAHGARKRQVKHLAGILRKREDELDPIRAFLDGLHQSQMEEKRDFHRLEELRERLCEADSFESVMKEVVEICPAIDVSAIERLARSVQRGGDKKAFREIFRRLRDAYRGE